ncbi:MAG: hypothetical protein AAB483_00370 [Patescibacteria group bacterium]
MQSKKKKPISNEDLLEAMGRGFQSMEDRMATKEDLKEFITKEDIKSFATKEDLKEAIENAVQPLATKVDLMDYAKRTDLEKLATKDDITRLEAKIDGQFIKEITPLKERVSKLEKQVQTTHP